MEHHSEAFVAFDTAKLRNAVAIADAGRNGEVRYLGEFDNTEAATRKLVAKLASKHARLTFCYEAGPTGYGLYRLIKSIGHDCIVVAPSLIPSKPGDRVKTNRRGPPIDYAAVLDSLDIMEKVMRRCGFRPGRRDRGEGGEVSARPTLGRSPRRRHQRQGDG
jgi:hypothetical protein